jgi:hypothetical protein
MKIQQSTQSQKSTIDSIACFLIEIHNHFICCFQRIAGAMIKGQEERRAVQGGVLKRMKDLEAKCGVMKSSKVRFCISGIALIWCKSR